MTHVPEWASIILALPPERRTEPDCRRLHALLRGLKSFDKFTEEIQMALCRAFTFDCVEEQRVVLKRGHVGQCFYVIYSGSVFVNATDKAQDGNEFVKTVAVLVAVVMAVWCLETERVPPQLTNRAMMTRPRRRIVTLGFRIRREE